MMLKASFVCFDRSLILQIFIQQKCLNLVTYTKNSNILKYDYLEIKFNDRNQVYDKIVWGLGGGFLYFSYESFVH